MISNTFALANDACDHTKCNCTDTCSCASCGCEQCCKPGK
uniref:Metallothionein 4 n=1 Tax=Laccaria bicolor TaxID=29883 RepID=A0A0F6MXK8_LACBI|nr:metallothionein 4 [Laccaria bicolor]